MRAVLALVGVVAAAQAEGQHCFNTQTDENGRPKRVYGDYEMVSRNGQLEVNGNKFRLKGLSWFGFETQNRVFHGLWAADYHFFIDFMQTNGFNAIRIPFSAELALTNPDPVSINFYNMNQDLQNLTSLEVLDKIIPALGEKGIVVMLDMHSLEHDAYMQNGVWYDQQYPQAKTLAAWDTMVNRYKSHWNVVAMDVFNEPFKATWGTGSNTTDFNAWCETVGDRAHSLGADWLVFCEGVASSPPCTDNCFWGEDLMGVKDHPVKLAVPNKVVYSPHCYGPSVSAQPYFGAPTFPDNMPKIWDDHWGYIRKMNGAAVSVGEWGGVPTGNDGVWMHAFAKYLASSDMGDAFFWCLNSDSGDTGGLLDGWKTPDTARLAICAEAQPNPTVITHNSTTGSVCFNF